jgi:adenosine deaminase
MSIESFVRAMPKVELNLQLEGALEKDTLLIIAEENDVPTSLKHFSQWAGLLDRPDYAHLDQLIQTVTQWIQQPEDLTRLVYDLGVALAKQNICYAEVAVNPLYYTEIGLTFEQFLNAINDGRDRVKRAWNVRIDWLLIVPRDQPRKADDVVRWATSTAAKKGYVLGITLAGREGAQAFEEFERSFRTAQKKELPRVVRAGDIFAGEEVLEAIQRLQPDRLADGWGTADAPDVIQLLLDNHIALDVCMAHSLCMGQVATYGDYPLRHLYDEGIDLNLSSGMPSLYKTNLSQEYLAAVEHCGFSIGELEELALRAVDSSLMADEEKQTLKSQFAEDYSRLHEEHEVAAESTFAD